MKNLPKCQGTMIIQKETYNYTIIQQKMYQATRIIKIIINALVWIYQDK